MIELKRRSFLSGLAAGITGIGLSGCVSPNSRQTVAGAGPGRRIVSRDLPPPADMPPPADLSPPADLPQTADLPASDAQVASLYGPVDGERFPIPAVNLSAINPAFLRRSVAYTTVEQPGTIIVDPRQRYLYLVQENGRAMRYGVGVGREGFGWSGAATINSKQEWPDWYPPKEMIQRQPELKKVASQLQSGLGVAGGPRNPLGARAMYLWQGNKDTLYRIHGTVEPWTIGKNVSSGCIRMINQDAIDLYERVPIGTKVVVLSSGGTPA